MCFFSDQERAEESRRISAGEGRAEWAALLGETRQEAAEARGKEKEALLKKYLQRQQEQRKRNVEPRSFFQVFGFFSPSQSNSNAS